MFMEERFYWLAFSLFSGIGPVKFSSLLNKFQTAKKAWEASSEELKPVVGKTLINEFEDFRRSFSFEDYQKRLRKNRVRFLTLQDENYPHLLKEIKKPPFVLFVKGDSSILSSRTSETSVAISEIASSAKRDRNDTFIAVVGTRKITSYGRQVTEMITRDLVNAGLTIVSGLAMGVDAVAHKTTIDNKGKTIAVLGCGVDCCTPSENEQLYDQILENGGCIVSELPLGHPPSVGSFPARNRIVAGISQAVLVTEGAVDSGALITANFALDEGRNVFAVPGPITSSLSKGPHNILAKGGRMVTTGEDIIRELGIHEKSIKGIKSIRSIKGDTDEEQKILDLLQNEPMHFDEIVRLANINSSQVATILSYMEIKGTINTSHSGIYSLSHKS